MTQPPLFSRRRVLATSAAGAGAALVPALAAKRAWAASGAPLTLSFAVKATETQETAEPG